MTREQYDARAMELLRDYANVYDPFSPSGHKTVAQFDVACEITAFVDQYWEPEFYPVGHRGLLDGR